MFTILLSCVLFFALSFVMAIVVYNLPVWCQSWTLTSTYGIACVGVFTALMYPESKQYIQFMALIFLSAFPGMLWLEFRQRWARVHYWEREGVPTEMQGRALYWEDKIDHLVEWWIDRRMTSMAVKEAQRIAEKECKN